jgi:hypothetical protein
MLLRYTVLALLLSIGPANAHDWYPRECCHEMDCAPVEHVEMVPAEGVTRVRTVHGSATIPASFPRRESKDHRMHVCMRPSVNGMKLLCVFMPPSS